MAGDSQLNAAVTITLNSAGNGTAEIGPENAGPPVWYIDTVLLTTSRPGNAPVPRASVYLDSVSPSNLQGITYDASFGQASADGLRIVRGQRLLVNWSGGRDGDLASVTVVGTRGTV